MVKYKTSTDKKIKVQIIKDGDTYTYDLPTDGNFSVLPLTQGDGDYKIKVYKNVVENEYVLSYQTEIYVKLSDEFLPFLYPNQYVNFTADSETVKKAEQLVRSAKSELDVVSIIYNFVIDKFTYDYEKAQTVKSGYLPDVDEVLKEKKGICFDYTAVMCCMLRSLGIPTKLVIGYVGDIYHAWISVYITDIGWVNNIIEFDGKDWKLMDPTMDSTSNSDKDVVKKINEGVNYIEKYAY
jgi:transglutaminase-like putative cysteine protease